MARVLLFAAAFVVRMIYLAELRAKSPFFDHPYLDAAYYLDWARRILGGDLLGHEVFVRAPGYPYFLALVGAIAGLHHWTIGVAQALLGAGTVLLVATLGERLFDRRIGLVAGWLAVFHGALVYWGGEILIETLFVFLATLTVCLLQAAVASGRPRRWVLAGFVAGLAVVTRPTGLALLAVVPLSAWFGRAKDPRVGAGTRARGMAVLLGTAAPLLLPALVSLRNYGVGGDFVPVASHGGINFWTGNNARADGKIVVLPEGVVLPKEREHEDNLIAMSVVRAEEVAGHPLKPSEVSAYWTKLGLEWIRQHPGEALLLWLKKFGYFWGGCEYTNNEDVYAFRRHSVLLSILLFPMGAVYLPGALLMPLSLFGLFAARQRARELAPSYLFLALYTLIVIAFFVSSRHRLPAVPIALPFAVVGGRRLLSLLRASERWAPRRMGEVALAAALLLVLGVNPNARPAGTIRQYEVFEAETRFARGLEARERGDWNAAASEFQRAAVTLPGDPAIAYGWGAALLNLHRYADAAARFEFVARATPNDPLVHYQLAVCYYEQGRLPEARAALARADALGAKVNPAFRQALASGR